LAAFSVLCCDGVGRYAVTVLLGGCDDDGRTPNPTPLFGGSCAREIEELKRRNVAIQRIPRLDSAAEIYACWLPTSEVVIRVDADSAFLPGVLRRPVFNFSAPLGYSLLNFRHTARSGLEQLFHADDGRMRTWPETLQVPEYKFLQAASQAARAALGTRLSPADLKIAMTRKPWPSEGISYISRSAIPAFCALRQELVEGRVIPTWDEEIVKLILACAQHWPMEPVRAEVLEYWEYGTASASHCVVNFRNRRRVGRFLGEILSDSEAAKSHLHYVRTFFDSLVIRTS
jgi:hypothetical protein